MVPFQYGSAVKGVDFCCRSNLLEQLTSHMEKGERFALTGEQRIGKTSILYEALRRAGQRGIVASFLNVKSHDDLCKHLIRRTLAAFQGTRLFDRLLVEAASLRPKLGTDPITGAQIVDFDANTNLGLEDFEHLIGVIASVCPDHPITIIFDDLHIYYLTHAKNDIERFRDILEACSQITFILSACEHTQKSRIFEGARAIFRKWGPVHRVEPVSFEDFHPYLLSKFGEAGRHIEEGVLKQVYDWCGGIPGNTQRFCEALWAISEPGERIGQEKINAALLLIFEREQKNYEYYLLHDLTALQVRVLMAVVTVGGKRTSSAEFLRAAGSVHASSAKRAIERLIEKNILVATGSRVKIGDPFFAAYLSYQRALVCKVA